MTMPLTLEWTLVTEGKEHRVEDQENQFTLTLPGYRLYPIHDEIEIRRHKESDQIGFGEIIELTWKDDTTICTYELTSLYSVN
ncbi:Protein of unknown function [Pelagirhabdus alkalitolerans]|uniref:DUF2584 domain-containing protein n=1 Tax=Pelagirhabdus alkalitolerans TaxID=1612202 RepID=A0A1G6H948_9BACI|nr:DUF2584 domain-containing protein [Pelagirhabdus alkalitolerans]SDB90809.1 Protein of unknown function [Pelagirhabdus alkalitolerans]